MKWFLLLQSPLSHFFRRLEEFLKNLSSNYRKAILHKIHQLTNRLPPPFPHVHSLQRSSSIRVSLRTLQRSEGRSPTPWSIRIYGPETATNCESVDHPRYEVGDRRHTLTFAHILETSWRSVAKASSLKTRKIRKIGTPYSLDRPCFRDGWLLKLCKYSYSSGPCPV